MNFWDFCLDGFVDFPIFKDKKQPLTSPGDPGAAHADNIGRSLPLGVTRRVILAPYPIRPLSAGIANRPSGCELTKWVFKRILSTLSFLPITSLEKIAMDNGEFQQGQPSPDAEQNFLRQLRQTFDQMPNEIPLYLFTDRGRDDVFVQS